MSLPLFLQKYIGGAVPVNLEHHVEKRTGTVLKGSDYK
jgi:hypothetical protein